VDLKDSFDTVAELYERARPTYPDELVDDLVAAIGGRRVLEIGSGTGKLTRSLVARDLDVTCIEPGANLAAVARRVVPDARIVEARFEDWVPDGSHDGVCCATAWHWLDADVAAPKVHSLLPAGGVLAVIGTHHVCPPGHDPFFREIQRVYASFGDGIDDLPDVGDIRHDDAIALRATGLFDVEDRSYLRVIEYDAETYIEVLKTYSGHIVMTDEQRVTLFDAVREIVGDRTISKHHLFCLHLAKKIG
jgi:SAM-dependent methyltransferase